MKAKKKTWLAVCIVCILVALICVGIVVAHYVKRGQDAEKNAEFVENAKKTETSVGTETTDPQQTEIVYADNPIDFDTICAENPDIYAWVTVPGTLVDYPVLQSATDDTYYLTHSVEKEESSSGAIYSESINAKDFTDPHTVLYGHNMRNDTMFGSLHSFEDRTFFDENRIIYIYTPMEKLTYQIFAAYEWSSEHLLNVYNTKDPESFRAYLDQVKSVRGMTSFVDEDVEVSETSCILTLSTCIGVNNNDSRYLVQGVLVSKEPAKYTVDSSTEESADE